MASMNQGAAGIETHTIQTGALSLHDQQETRAMLHISRDQDRKRHSASPEHRSHIASLTVAPSSARSGSIPTSAEFQASLSRRPSRLSNWISNGGPVPPPFSPLSQVSDRQQGTDNSLPQPFLESRTGSRARSRHGNPVGSSTLTADPSTGMPMKSDVHAGMGSMLVTPRRISPRSTLLTNLPGSGSMLKPLASLESTQLPDAMGSRPRTLPILSGSGSLCFPNTVTVEPGVASIRNSAESNFGYPVSFAPARWISSRRPDTTPVLQASSSCSALPSQTAASGSSLFPKPVHGDVALTPRPYDSFRRSLSPVVLPRHLSSTAPQPVLPPQNRSISPESISSRTLHSHRAPSPVGSSSRQASPAASPMLLPRCLVPGMPIASLTAARLKVIPSRVVAAVATHGSHYAVAQEAKEQAVDDACGGTSQPRLPNRVQQSPGVSSRPLIEGTPKIDIIKNVQRPAKQGLEILSEGRSDVAPPTDEMSLRYDSETQPYTAELSAEDAVWEGTSKIDTPEAEKAVEHSEGLTKQAPAASNVQFQGLAERGFETHSQGSAGAAPLIDELPLRSDSEAQPDTAQLSAEEGAIWEGTPIIDTREIENVQSVAEHDVEIHSEGSAGAASPIDEMPLTSDRMDQPYPVKLSAEDVFKASGRTVPSVAAPQELSTPTLDATATSCTDAIDASSATHDTKTPPQDVVQLSNALADATHQSTVDLKKAGRTYERIRQRIEALQRLSGIPEEEVALDISSFHASISACEKEQQWVEAVRLLSEMPRKGLDPDVICFNAAINACEKGQQWAEALRLFMELPNFRLVANDVSFTAAMNACQKGQQWAHALQILCDMSEIGIAPNVVSFNAAISTCAKGRQWLEALRLLSDMAKKGVAPNIVSFTAATVACEKGQQWVEVLRLLGEMPSKGTLPNTVIFNAAISACEQRQQWVEAMRLLDEMARKAIPRNVVSFTATISACVKGQQWVEALRLLSDMDNNGITPDVVCCNVAISACETGQQWAEALRLLRDMPTKFIHPNVISFTAAIGACQKGQQWMEALRLFREMPKHQ